jgi:hypothetical protein
MEDSNLTDRVGHGAVNILEFGARDETMNDCRAKCN